MHAIVIGGGFGGIASALRLRAQGYQVSLLERGAALGGRAQVLSVRAFGMMQARRSLPRLFCSMNCLSCSESVARTI